MKNLNLSVCESTSVKISVLQHQSGDAGLCPLCALERGASPVQRLLRSDEHVAGGGLEA